MIVKVNVLLVVHFFGILLDFDYVEKVMKVNDDDYVDLISFCHNEIDLNVHFHFHYSLMEIELVFYKYLSSMLMKKLAMIFYHYVVIVVQDFENNVLDGFLMVEKEIDVF